MAVTRLADVIVPEIFTSYTQQLTEEKARLIQAGILVRDPMLDQLLAGGGLTFNVPSFRDLDPDDERVSTDDPTQRIPDDGSGTPPNAHGKISTSQEVAVRLSRNYSWSTMQLAGTLAGADPMAAIASRVGFFWERRLQRAFVSTMLGIFADNDKAPDVAMGDTHDQGDMTVDVSGLQYMAGVTDLSLSAFIDATTTMGDSEDDLGVVMMHSIVYSRARKNSLIDFIPDAVNPTAVSIPVFNGRRVIVDDGMPFADGVFQTWIFGAGAVRMGVGTPAHATEIERKPEAGQGGGQDILWNRVEWTLHPVGHAYVGSSPDGGPNNGATPNNLAHEDSWSRRWPERKQIKIARLITREFAV